ncbi:hypothetical protein ACHAWF_016831 [Thalassiosira exigua]
MRSTSRPLPRLLLVAALSTAGGGLPPASAFLSPLRPTAAARDVRLRASSPSLADQLASLSYDGSFLGLGGKAPAPAEAVAAAAKAAEAAVGSPPPATVLDALASALDWGALTAHPIWGSVASAAELGDALATVVQTYESLVDDRLASSPMGDAWIAAKSSLGPIVEATIHPDVPPSATLLISSCVAYYVASTALSFGQEPPPNAPYPTNKYDPATARRYFDGRGGLVAGRAIRVAYLSGTFLAGLALDFAGGKLESNSPKRAEELSVLLTKLGPSFIKIGQSLSIRTDLLSPAYVRGLKSLQDQVPPFSTEEAREIVESELGSKIEDVFVDFPGEPIAAASLGQVYQATVRGDGEAEERVVAVKVQRPNILNQIALDMHLIREAAPVVKRTFDLNTDFVGVVDSWGAGFVDELDYIEEALNAKSFAEGIARTPLAGVVFAPPVVDELTTGKVLTTDWVVGERLDRSAKDDVSILCSIAMNTYLTMMLETGVLHCDPHPGNLLRTTDGKLCILDWGMVTRLEPDLQITLIEHMAHLTSADYEEIPKDLLLLGFIPEDKADLIRDSGVVETLAEIYGAWTAGGGAAAINVNKVIADLQDLTAEKGNLFQIPPYFAYIAKSFSVLEGIGLSNDAKYSIVNECLPYVSKRLLTDKSERTGGALSTFIFGPEKSSEDRIIDYDRVEQLVSGFSDYSTSASGELLGKNSTRTELVEGVATQVLDLLATEEETPLQRIFVEQLAKIIAATTRSAWSQLRERSGVLPSGRTVLGTLVDPLGIFRSSPVVRPNELDERTVETTRNLIELLTSTTSGSSAVDVSTLSNTEIIEISSIVAQKLFERRSGVVKTTNRLAMQLLQLTADRLEKGGERDIVVVPLADTVSDGRILEEDSKEEKKPSDRLSSARQILATIEQ